MNNILEKIEEIKKPIVHIAFGFFVCSLSYGAWGYSCSLSISLIVLFLVWEYKYTNREFLSVIIAILILAFTINYNYYNYEFNSKSSIRIISQGYSFIGEVDGRKVLLVNNVKGLELGEKITISGEFTKKINRENGTVGEVKILSYKVNKDDFITKLYELKKFVRDRLSENIGKRKAGLIISIAYGDKSLLDNEDNRDMKLLGIVHAISVSGMHVAVLYLILGRITRREVALGLTGVYVVFTGMAFSSIRALIMIVVLCYAKPFRRKYNPLAAISFSALVVLAWKPYTCYDIGFLLSYASTLGIILYNEKIRKHFYRLPKVLGEGISLSLSSQVFSLPLLIMYFKSVSLNILFGNIILIPLINILMILGNILPMVVSVTGLFDFICYVLNHIINFFDYLIDILYKFSLPVIELNSYYAKFMVVLIIGWYFYKNGFKKLIYLPLVYLVIIFIEMYSPFATIQYFKEGAIYINHKGQGAIITNKRNINISKIKGETKSGMVVPLGEEYGFLDGITVKQQEKDFIMKYQGKGSILLKLSKDSKTIYNYDIIDFEKDKINKLIIIGDKLFKLY